MSKFMSNKTNKIALIILGAAIAVALVRYFSMSQEERKELIDRLKDRTNDLLKQTDQTVEKIDQFMAEYDDQGENAWIDKLFVLKKMFQNLYDS